MEYELLKQQLKDNGYTGEFDLSSLVKACGDDFAGLHRVPNTVTVLTWGAIANNGVFKVGSTHEESVAKLWLELNKKLDK